MDDDPVLLETTRAVLDLHHVTRATTDPLVALDLLHSTSFHVVVCDWMMPVMDGIEFFRRASKVDPSLAGLLISGRLSDLADEVRREERKMLGLLGKPFSPAQLLDRVDQMGRLSSMKKQVRALKGVG